MMGGGAISWSSKRQPIITLSTTEAEYMASTQATKEAIWMAKLMKELGYMKEKKAMVIRCDNQGAISLTKNPMQHVRTKHIDVQHYFVPKQVENGEITFKYCSTEDMVADVLTKALPKERYNKLITMFRLETS
jgi:KUP system potassium uptake protein